VIDVEEQINAVSREVGGRTLAAGEARSVTISRTYRDRVEDVWDACTNAERVPRWLPVSGAFELGGRFQIENNASGTIEACEPPRSFSATWEFGGQVSWITLTLSATDDGGTRFALEHVAHVDDALWEQFGPGAVGIGWDLLVLDLTRHLLADADGFDAPRFMTLASAAWADTAAAAEGKDAAWAKAAADATTAFYTEG
jgi:uncharacterized protein YndB with AHSA1/START domain